MDRARRIGRASLCACVCPCATAAVAAAAKKFGEYRNSEKGRRAFCYIKCPFFYTHAYVCVCERGGNNCVCMYV